MGSSDREWSKSLRTAVNSLRDKYKKDFFIKTIADRSIQKKASPGLENTLLTTDINAVLNDPDIHVVVELIGGMTPAKDILLQAVRCGKHVVTANKELLATCGQELFREANANNRMIYFEAAVGAGIPIIRTITEGVAGNKFNGIYGIINGTCNFILTEMSNRKLTFPGSFKRSPGKRVRGKKSHSGYQRHGRGP